MLEIPTLRVAAELVECPAGLIRVYSYRFMASNLFQGGFCTLLCLMYSPMWECMGFPVCLVSPVSVGSVFSRFADVQILVCR